MDQKPEHETPVGYAGSLTVGVVVGLAIEVGFAAVAALGIVVVRPFGWSLPLNPLALVIVAVLALVVVVKACLGPVPVPVVRNPRWVGRRRAKAVPLVALVEPSRHRA